MAGLLDFLDSPETQLGLGLLSAGGPTMQPMSFGQRLAGALGQVQAQRTAAEERALKQRLVEAQIGNYNSEIESRKATAAKTNGLLNIAGALLGGGQQQEQPAPQSPPVGGAQSGAGQVANALAQATPQQRVSMISRMSEDQVAGLKAIGLDVTEIWKTTRPDMQVHNGYVYNKNGVQPGFLPSINQSANGQTTVTIPGADGMPRVMVPQGATEAVSAFTSAAKRAENQNTLLPPDRLGLDGRPILATVDQAVQQATGNGQPTASVAAPAAMNLSGTPQEQLALIQRIADPTYRQEALSAWQVKYGNGGVPGIASNRPAGGPIQFSGPLDQKAGEAKIDLSRKAGEQVNDAWIKNSYEPVLTAGRDAQTAIENVTIARQALSGLGNTGWGTETKAVAANVLTSLGIGSKNAAMFAANAERFNQVASTRLWAELAAQKGPQTEGDAKRAQAVYAKLSNVTESNAFILDLAQARAQRDAMKSQFYSHALPMAKERGALNEIDTEWSSRAPSIFDMPSMQRWK